MIFLLSISANLFWSYLHFSDVNDFWCFKILIIHANFVQFYGNSSFEFYVQWPLVIGFSPLFGFAFPVRYIDVLGSVQEYIFLSYSQLGFWLGIFAGVLIKKLQVDSWVSEFCGFWDFWVCWVENLFWLEISGDRVNGSFFVIFLGVNRIKFYNGSEFLFFANLCTEVVPAEFWVQFLSIIPRYPLQFFTHFSFMKYVRKVRFQHFTKIEKCTFNTETYMT